MSVVKLNFGGHLVAFIDILGQSEELKKLYKVKWWEDEKSVKDILSSTYGHVLVLRKDISDIVESFSKLTDASQLAWKLPFDVQDSYRESTKTNIISQNIADSIILTVPLNITNNIIPLKSVYGVLVASAISMITSLSRGFCFRAGIEFGPSIFNHALNEVYGSALSESVAYEKKAGFPRIVVGEHLVKYLKSLDTPDVEQSIHPLNSRIAKSCLKLISRDRDGLYFVDYLGGTIKNALGDVDSSQMIKLAILYINKQLDKFKSNEKIYNKYSKLKEYFLTKTDVWGTTLINFSQEAQS